MKLWLLRLNLNLCGHASDKYSFIIYIRTIWATLKCRFPGFYPNLPNQILGIGLCNLLETIFSADVHTKVWKLLLIVYLLLLREGFYQNWKFQIIGHRQPLKKEGTEDINIFYVVRISIDSSNFCFIYLCVCVSLCVWIWVII